MIEGVDYNKICILVHCEMHLQVSVDAGGANERNFSPLEFFPHMCASLTLVRFCANLSHRLSIDISNKLEYR